MILKIIHFLLLPLLVFRSPPNDVVGVCAPGFVAKQSPTTSRVVITKGKYLQATIRKKETPLAQNKKNTDTEKLAKINGKFLIWSSVTPLFYLPNATLLLI